VPLIKSASKPAFKKNVGALMDEIGESPHVQSRAQALAIAYSTKRRAAAKSRRSMRNGQVSDRARQRMVGSDEDEDRIDAATA
jgi:hypothetical protein